MLIKGQGCFVAALLAMTVGALCPVSATAKDYENFDLPKTGVGRTSLDESRLNYTSPRVQLRGKNMRLSAPGYDANEFLAARESFLAEKRDESIKLLRQQMDAGLKNNKDNVLLRLGQLYAEKYQELSYRENELYTNQLQDYEKLKTTDKNAKPPKIDKSRSDQYLKEALALFYDLERNYPKHPKLDEILFFIGFVEMESGNTAKGSGYLERVIRNYPRSRKYDEAVVYLGDFYFDKVRFREAMGKYNVLLARKNSSLFHYANYKVAWCELNTNQQTKGLRRMKSLVSDLKGTDDKAKFNLREQALRDLVIFFGEVEAVDEAIEFFTAEQGRDKALENLKLIADILRSKARDEAAIRAYGKLVAEFGDSPDAPKLQIGMYEARARLGQTAKAVDSLVTAIERYGADSDWAKNQPKEKAAEVKETLDYLQNEALKVGLYHHQSGQKASKSDSYEYALRIYTALWNHFPNHPDRKKVGFYRAEILFMKNKWLDAANSYMAAAKVPPKDKMTDEAVYAALLALDRLTQKSEKLERFTKDQQKSVSTTPEEIPEGERRFIEVGEFYMKEYPAGNRIVDVQFRISAIYYRYHHFDKALPMFKVIALKHPKHRSAVTAANLALDIHNILKEYDKLDETAALFASTKDLGDSKFKAEMAAISGAIGFKKVESLETQSKWSEAGDSYMKYYRANPQSPLAEKALYNAYVSYEKSGDATKAAETSRMFVDKYPKSEYTQTLTLGLAKASEKQYDFDQAQRRYHDFYKRFPKDKEARKALYNAAVFAELLEQNREAMNLYNEYLKDRSVSAQERKAIQISQAKLHRKLGEWDKANLIYRRMARDAGTLDDRLAILGDLARQYEKAGKINERNNLMNEIRVMYKNASKKPSGSGVQFAAEAEFKNVAKERQKYEEIKLKFPAEDLVYLLKRKQKALEKLANSYDSVVEIGVPEWGVASLYEKSEAYDSFVKNFRSVQIPASYKGPDRVGAEKALKDIDTNLVKPIEKKSQDIAKACSDRAAQFFVATEYAGRCRSKAKKSDTDAEPSGILPQPSYASTRWNGEVAKRE